MAKEKREEESRPKGETKGESKGKGGKKRQHLREVRSVQAHDGSIVHHHTYADSAEAPFSHPERGPMATSATPEEAGQHVAEMFGQNAMGGGAPEPGGGEAPQPEAPGGTPGEEA